MDRKQALMKACFLLREQAKEESLAKFLLMYLLDESSEIFNYNMDKSLEQHIVNQYFMLIEEHIKTDKPLSHLVGFDYFYGRKFYVTKDVLSPRMETEELVYHIIEYVTKHCLKNIKILDMCTGSGVIGITLKKELENLNVSLTISDISEPALAVSKKNADYNHAEIEIIHSDLFHHINEKFDIIVSNPPYIAYDDKETIKNNVLHYDPHLALFASENGMYFYRKILEQAKAYLNHNGMIFFEIGHNQKDLIKLLAADNYYDVEVIKDINHKDRIAKIKPR